MPFPRSVSSSSRLLTWLSAVAALVLLVAACGPATPAPADPAPPPPAPREEPKAPAPAAPKEEPKAVPAPPEAKPAMPPEPPATEPAPGELPPLTDVQRQAVEEFYRGRTITIVVGLSAGGGFDLMARLVGRHIGRHIPGNPTVIVENRTGAGGMVAANYVYRAAAQDGTVIHAASEILLNSQLLDQDGVEYDFAGFRWLGSTQDVTVSCYARTDAGLTTLQDAIDSQEPIVVGATAPGSNAYDFPTVLSNLLTANFQIVSGYPGSSQIRLAMEQGEVQAHCIPYEAILPTIQEWLDDNFVNVFAQQAQQRHPDLQDVPLAEEFAVAEEDRQVLRLVTISGAISKPFAVGPGVPDDRVLALRHAFEAVMHDRALLDEAAQGQIDLSFKTGAEVQQIIQNALRSDPRVVDRLKAALQ